MKLSFEKSALRGAISIVMKAVPSRTTMPILECILIDASEDEIKLTANDMELGIETKAEGSILEHGKIALDAKLFSEIIRKLPDSMIWLESDEELNVTITCEKSNFRIAGKPGDEFSYLPYIERNKYISLSQFTLKEMIRQTIFSIAVNENNRIMTGELFQIQDNKLKIVSLDGHRIAIRTMELKKEYEDRKVIVPGKTLSEVSKILPGEAKDTINLYLTDKHILFEFGETKVVSRLLEGKFYNIGQMLSNDYETKLTINKMELLRCLDRSTLFVKESDKKPIILKIENEQMNLMISSQIGSMKDQIAINKEGKDLVIGFNPKFLVDALRVIDEEEVTIYLINSIAPCIIRDEKSSYLYLILPINVSNSNV